MFESLAYRKQAAFVFVSQGVDEGPDGLKLISDVIQEKLGITMSVLMGANIANEVADEKFCETTIGQYGQISFRLVWPRCKICYLKHHCWDCCLFRV